MARDVEPRSPRGVAGRRTGGLRPLHTLGVIAVGVVAVLVAFWALSFIVGVVWFLVKVVAVVALVGGVLWLFLGRRHRR